MMSYTICFPQGNDEKRAVFEQKLLEAAGEWLIQEMLADDIYPGRSDLTTTLHGKNGIYETCNGEVVGFIPAKGLTISIITDNGVMFTDNIAGAMQIARLCGDYELG